METQHIFLIPGFFGFGRLGQIHYFHHVEDALVDQLAAQGIEARVHTVSTSPTGSIPSRVGTLLDRMEEVAGDDHPIHLVGHSTGGIDARLFATPGVSVAKAERRRPFRERLRSIVTVATPHRGTPLARTFDGVFGKKLLFVVSLGTIYTLRFGGLPVRAAFKLLGILGRLDDRIGLRNTVVDQFYDNLLSDFDGVREAEVRSFLRHVLEDRSALGQLTPGSIELLNSAAGDAPDVAYGSVVTYTPRASLGTIAGIGAHPYNLASHGIFRVLYRLASVEESGLPGATSEQIDEIAADLGITPGSGDSDGVVPTMSQPWGTVVTAVEGDHLDVCGHFDGADHDPPHVDWLVSGSDFDRARFDRTWHAIADFIAESS